jgi:hypothetical protein
MPLRSGGALANDRLYGRQIVGLITSKSLAPQKVAEVKRPDPTANTYQRKVFTNGTYFFLFYHDYDPVLARYPIIYAASINGISWEKTVLLTDIRVYAGGHLDIGFPNRGAKDYNGNPFDFSIYYTTTADLCVWRPYRILDKQLIAGGSTSIGGQTTPQGGSICPSLNGQYEYAIFHRNATYKYVRTHSLPSNVVDDSKALAFGSTTTGGNQILPYKSSSPYKMLALCKGGDNKLYYNIVNEPTATFALSFTEIATLGTGFNDFCAASEAQKIGDPERVHLVYIKSSGELCYRKFENDVWTDETVLVASGVSYPVIAVGKGGRLYVFYVREGVIKLLKFNGVFWEKEQTLFPNHAYNNPAYLSTNQNVQFGKICLVWTEGKATPYEVWFSYLEDG